MSQNADDAVAMFLQGYNCAQSVLACCGRDFGVPRETAIRLAQAFGGGIGKTGNLCGALTGALMMVGQRCAAMEAGDAQSKAKAADLAQAVMQAFGQRNGSLMCRELTGADLRTPEGQKKFKEADAIHKVCAKAINNAVAIVEELLAKGSK